MHQHPVFQKKQRNTNRRHLVQVTPKIGYPCPWCSHEFDPDALEFYQPGTTGDDVSSGESARGALAPHAASVLMKLLYAARIARFDLLRSINLLARNVTKWTVDV